MRTLIALSSLVLVLLAVVIGKELLRADPPQPTSSKMTSPPPQSPTTPPPPKLDLSKPTPSHEAAATPTQPKQRLYDALNRPVSDETQKTLVIAELEKSGAGAPEFRQRGNAFGTSLVASGIASDFRCYAAGCYIAPAKTLSSVAEQRVLHERDVHAAASLLAITGTESNQLIVLINTEAS